MENNRIKIGRYRHFKGNEYEVIGIGKHSETLEEMVIYRARYGKEEIWIRPLSMFAGETEKDGKKVQRFEYIGE